MRLIDADEICNECIEETILATCEGCVIKEHKLNKSIDPESLIQYHVDELSRTFHYRVVKDEPEKQGEWKHKKHKIFGNTYEYVCSVCGCDYALAEYDYCPNCGAKMKGGTA